MRFSFIVPAYNRFPLVDNTLKALALLDYDPENYEIIFVDDGSDEKLEQLVTDRLSGLNFRYLYIPRDSRSSRSRARNAGLKLAEGEYCVFIDSDIILPPWYLREADRYLARIPIAMIFGNRLMLPADWHPDFSAREGLIRIFAEARCLKDIREYRHQVYSRTSYNACCDEYIWMQVYGCSLVLPRSIVLDLAGFDESLLAWGLEDQEFGYRLVRAGVLPFVNTRMDILHQNHGERNDFSIEESKREGFDRNMDYFLGKHPNAVKIHPKFVKKFLSGELPVFGVNSNREKIRVHHIKQQSLKTTLDSILGNIHSDRCEILVRDSFEQDDLDIEIQLLGKTPAPVRYFPDSQTLGGPDS